MNSVIIIEKVKYIREGMKILINRFSQHSCEHTFTDIESFLNQTKPLNPDLLLLQLESNKTKLLSNLRLLKRKYPSLKVILLTMNEENELLYDALSNGAVAYVHKNAPHQRIIKVLEDASQKKVVINSVVARKTEKFIRENKLDSFFKDNEINYLKKVTEGNNLPAIEQSMKVDIEEIKRSFWNVFERLFDFNNRDFVKGGNNLHN